MAKQPLGGRPTKAALLRLKVATTVVSVAAFLGSLGVVAYLHPGVHNTAGLTSQTQSVATVASLGSSASTANSSALQLSGGQRQASVVPLVRTHGS